MRFMPIRISLVKARDSGQWMPTVYTCWLSLMMVDQL